MYGSTISTSAFGKLLELAGNKLEEVDLFGDSVFEDDNAFSFAEIFEEMKSRSETLVKLSQNFLFNFLRKLYVLMKSKLHHLVLFILSQNLKSYHLLERARALPSRYLKLLIQNFLF
jgi:hypothetical protein